MARFSCYAPENRKRAKTSRGGSKLMDFYHAEIEYKKKEKALYAAKKRRWLKELEKSKK